MVCSVKLMMTTMESHPMVLLVLKTNAKRFEFSTRGIMFCLFNVVAS